MWHGCAWQEVRHAVGSFPFNTRDGFARPGCLPNSIFTSVKGTKSPHNNAKLPYSAHGQLVFAVHSLEILGKFIPPGPWPAFWHTWVLHVQILNMMMAFDFTFAQLMKLEETVMIWQAVTNSVHEYSKCWRPKVHWCTHLAHDIFMWGPPRLLWSMIPEKKNGEFVRGVKRSNYHNPCKSAAEFWAWQSEWQLRNTKRRTCCDSSHVVGSMVTTSGPLLQYNDAWEVRVVQQQLNLANTALVEFLSTVSFQGVSIPLSSYCILDNTLVYVRNIMRISSAHFVAFSLHGLVSRNQYGSYVCNASQLSNVWYAPTGRVVELRDIALIPVWHFSTPDAMDIVRFLPKW